MKSIQKSCTIAYRAAILSRNNEDLKGGKICTKSSGQKKKALSECSTYQKYESSIEAWFEVKKGTSGH